MEIWAFHCSNMPHSSILTKSIAIENISIAAYMGIGQG